MDDSTNVNDWLETVAMVLIRCFWIGFAIVLFWFVIILCASDFVYQVHSTFFTMSETQFDLMHYGGLGLTKLVVFIFFLIPYLAIKMVQAKMKG